MRSRPLVFVGRLTGAVVVGVWWAPGTLRPPVTLLPPSGEEGKRPQDSDPSLALQAGIHPKVVSERLGHATVSITLDTSSHAIPALQRRRRR